MEPNLTNIVRFQNIALGRYLKVTLQTPVHTNSARVDGFQSGRVQRAHIRDLNLSKCFLFQTIALETIL